MADIKHISKKLNLKAIFVFDDVDDVTSVGTVCRTCFAFLLDVCFFGLF